MPSLTVFCPLGLSNRLRVLLSGLTLAEAGGRAFRMLWPLTPACAASFADLFTDDLSVTTVEAEAVAAWPYVSGWFGQMPDLLVTRDSDIVIGHPTWLLRPGRFPHHDVLLSRAEARLAALQPAPSVRETIEVVRRRHFRSAMIGVHLRRGDFVRERPDTACNTTQALAAVDRALAERPDAGILLCTDDGAADPATGAATRRTGVRETFAARYGARLVVPVSRSLDRRSSVAVQDALAELHLLRACDVFVGTQGSSFSEMVVTGRPGPHILVAGATPAYARLERLARATGVLDGLEQRGRRDFGHSVPFPVLLRHYSRAPLRRLRRLLRPRHE